MTFTPTRVSISNITQANPGVVTTSPNHNMTTGQIVRMHVPQTYGMIELNQKLVSITVLSANTFSMQYSQVTPPINVDTTNFAAFSVPSTSQFTAEVLAVGSGPTPKLSPQTYVVNNVCESNVDDAITNVEE